MAAAKENSGAHDTGRQRIGSVYARALLGITERAGKSATVLAELDSLVDDVLAKLPQLGFKLSAPRVPFAEKEQLLDKAFKSRMSSELLTFVKVVVRHGRGDCLPDIRRAAQQLHNQLRGRVEVRLVTATAVDQSLVDQVSAKLKKSLGREVVLTHEVDATLIGGLVVRVGDTVYDGSVSNRLELLRDQTLERTTDAVRQHLEKFVSA